jgi:hypothetical protein
VAGFLVYVILAKAGLQPKTVPDRIAVNNVSPPATLA